MANISKFLQQGEKQRKTITKTFRLTEDAQGILKDLANFTKKSQNELINEILEDYEVEFTFHSNIEALLGLLNEEQYIQLKKTYDYDFKSSLEYVYDVFYEDSVLFEIYKIFNNTENKRTCLFEKKTELFSIYELSERGVDSNYKWKIYSKKDHSECVLKIVKMNE